MTMDRNLKELIKRAFEAFNARDIDTVLLSMSQDIEWPQAFGSGCVRGHDAIKKYWMTQWTHISTHIKPVGFSVKEDGALEIIVQQTVKDMQGRLMFDGQVRHLYRLQDGLLNKIHIETV